MKSKKLDAVYFKSLHAIIDRLFEQAYKRQFNWIELAEHAGLSSETVRKLGKGKTKYPQFRTIELLAYALGGAVTFVKDRNKAVATIKITWTPKLLSGRKKSKRKAA